MALAPELIDVLVCPESRAALVYVASEDVLVSAEARLVYRVEDGIPVLLVEEARRVDQAEITRLLAG